MMVDIYGFAFDRVCAAVLPLFGIRPATTRVEVDDKEFRVRFGPFRLRTDRANIAGAVVTGPYRWIKVFGVHLSLADRGVTFGTNGRRGVCLTFRRPVAGVGARLGVRHPNATVTVADPEALVAALRVDQHAAEAQPAR
jgi:hypothetical protein